MKLGLFLGLIAGGILAVLLKEADSQDAGPLGTVKRQLSEATQAGKEEAAQKEAEMLADYEASKREPPKKT